MWKAAGGKLSMERKICDTSKFDIVDGGVLSMDFYKDNMLLCTNSSSIYMLALKEKNDSITTIMESHYKGELWA